jgi:hypothetical protein
MYLSSFLPPHHHPATAADQCTDTVDKKTSFPFQAREKNSPSSLQHHPHHFLLPLHAMCRQNARKE